MTRGVTPVWARVPRGGSLPDEVFWRRHRWIVAALWLHVPLLLALTALGPRLADTGAALIAPVLACAVAASIPSLGGRRLRPCLAALGLLVAGEALVAWGGQPELYVHQLAVVALVALYRDWAPFLVAIGVVLSQEILLAAGVGGLGGSGTWTRAALHGSVIGAAAVAAVAGWRHQERSRVSAVAERGARRERAARSRIAEAVAAEMPLDDLFQLVARETADFLGVAQALVGRFDADRITIVGTHGAGGGILGWAVPPESGASMAEVRRRSAPARVVYRELPEGDRARTLAERDGFVEGVAAPIGAGGALWGALMASASDGHDLPPSTEQRLAGFGELVGLAIQGAESRRDLLDRASADPLTGLLNHRAFHERLEDEVARAVGRGLALVMIDLDHFKDINDIHGHQAGDTVLVELAARLRAGAHPCDVLGRVGGEEFAWLMPDAHPDAALAACERLRVAVGTTPFGRIGRVTLSAGLCSLEAGLSAAELVRLADEALYVAKRSGRDRTVACAGSRPAATVLEPRDDARARAENIKSLIQIARTVDQKLPGTHLHAEHVAGLAVLLARELGWPPDRLEALHLAGLLHDVGKITAPDSFLVQPGALTDAQRERVRAHAALGAEMVTDVLGEEQVAWIRGHHERYDGLGYPDGLAGETIPLGARLLTLADSWDAMTSLRPHRRTLTPEQALEDCRAQRGRHFDPALVTILERLAAAGAIRHRSGTTHPTAA
jgi:diguanylate cyclase (GGDEF)-like protein/putative nucleotidyltransferase with HDIG domain